MLDPVGEEAPVGQAGQRIVEGVVLELLLRAPPIGHVGADGGGPRDLSRPVPEHGVAPPHHAPVPVAGHDRRLLVRGHRAELHAVAQGRPPRLPVLLRYEGREPLAPDDVFLLVADQLQEEGIAVGDDALAIEEPGHELDRLQDVAHAALGFAHGFFGPAALGDVEGGHQRGGLAAEIEGAPGELDPAIVGPGEARLVAEAGHGRRRRLQDAVADDVVGIRVEAIEEGTIDELGRGGAGQRGRRLVRIADAALVDDEDGGGGALEDGAELLLGGEHGSVGHGRTLRVRSARGPPSGERHDADGHTEREERRHHQPGRSVGAGHPGILPACDLPARGWAAWA